MPRYISPQVQYFDSLGVPLNGGKLFFYEPSTLIPKNTYSDTALTIANTNPIILAVNGSPSVNIWLNGTYRVILKDSSDNVIWDKDPVGGDSSDRLPWTAWVNGISYETNNIVLGSNDRYYISIQEPNLGNDPISSPAWWSEVRVIRVYNSSETYPANTVVQDTSGYLWRSKVLTAGATPALGSAFWEPAVDGIDELNLLTVPSNLAGPANLVKSRFYRLTGAGPYTLPSAATAAVGEPIYLIKDPSVNPSIVAQATQKINVAGTKFDDILYNVASSITLTSDGTEWELN